jgi:hypothetical protein
VATATLGETAIERQFTTGTRHRTEKLSAVRQLIVAAIGSGMIYAAYLTFVAFLPEHLLKPRIYLFGVLGQSYGALVVYLLGIGILFSLAIVAWRAARTAQGRAIYAWALIPPAIFGFLLVLTMPLTSRDIFYYISCGRTLGIYGANPYKLPPSAFPNDPLFQYANWPDYTSPYGPIWLLISGGVARIANGDLFWSVFLFKLVAFVGYLVCGGLIWAILRARGKSPLAGTVLWLWNPLVLLEFTGAGHNDVLMLTGVLLGIWLYLTGRIRLALAALALAAMVKSVALIALPLVLWHYLAPLDSWAARARAAVRVLWLPALIIAAFIGPFWAGAATFGPVQESSHYYSSLGHIARVMLEWRISPRPAGEITRGSIVLALLIGYAIIVWRTPGNDRTLLTGTSRAIFLLLALWPFFVPWYCAWAVAIVAALSTQRHSWRAIILCAGANLSYVFQFYLPLRMNSSVEFRSTLSALIIFVPFLLTFVPWGTLWQRTGQRRRQQIAAPPLG